MRLVVPSFLAVAALVWLLWPDHEAARSAAAPHREPAPAADDPIAAPPAPEPARRSAEPTDTPATASEGKRLRGSVVRVDGTPVPGARVVASRPYSPDTPRHETSADGAGRFALTGLDGPVLVTAHAAGLACREGMIGRLAAPGDGVRLVMDAAHTWTGRVIDADGQAVADATVQARSWKRGVTVVPGLRRTMPGLRATTNARGEFTLGPLPHGAWPLSIDHDVHARWDGRLPTNGSHVEVQLERGVIVDGVVLDWEGRPVHGARVAAYSRSPVRNTVTDDQGRFVVRGLRDWDKLHLQVSASGSQSCKVTPEPGRRRGVEIRLRRGYAIRGVVVDPGGRPVPGVRVRAAGRHARTRADGRFGFGGVAAGRYPVRVGEAVVDAEAGGADLRIVHRAVVVGVVRDAATGAPVVRFRVRGLPMESADGSFRFARTAMLGVEANGYAPWKGRPSTGPMEVRLHRPTSLRLRATDELGAPFTDTHIIHFESRDGRPVAPQEQSGSAFDGDGRWLGHGLPRARLRLVVSSAIVDGAFTRWTFDLDLRDARDGVREIAIDRAAGVSVER